MQHIDARQRALAGLSAAIIGRTSAGWLIVCVIAAAIGGGLFAVAREIGSAASPVSAPVAMHSYPLGIDLPAGADVASLPTGLTDYLRPDAWQAAPVAMRSYPLGIDLPAGADVATLPTGLTDYLRPDARPAAPVAMRSYPLGIDLPAGADVASLPTGLTDYLRPDR